MKTKDHSQETLRVENLSLSYPSQEDSAASLILKDLSFQIKPSEIVALVGESGSGKTQLALSLIRLLGKDASLEAKGIFLRGVDLFPMTEKELCQVRGKKISMVFQEPMTSLNPVFSLGYQIEEALRCHGTYTKEGLKAEAIRLLELVRMSDPERRYNEYPHQISGGMRQRVLIAMAIASKPDLLIADEPTTALDVTTGAQILDLLRTLREETGVSILFVTHDLGIVAELCDSVLVMYGGRIVERGSVKGIFTQTSHPYTKLLLDSVPRLGRKMKPLPGSVEKKETSDHEDFCPFFHRCSKGKVEPCLNSFPPPVTISEDHKSACFFAQEGI